MPTIVMSVTTVYTIPEGTLVYLTDELTPRTGQYNSIRAPGEPNMVFKTKRDLHFTEMECVGSHGDGGVALFKLEPNSHPEAKYIVADTRNVIFLQGKTKMGQKEFNESGVGVCDEELPF